MRNEHGQFAMSISATSILDQPYLDDDDDSQDYSDEDDTSQDNSDDDFDTLELDDDTNEALLDNFMASTAQAEKTRGVDPKHLSKIWRISYEDAQSTIDVTTQFTKEIGAPDSFVADMSGEQMSSEVKKFCNDIGTTLRALEEGTT